jgi:hypothetical protein
MELSLKNRIITNTKKKKLAKTNETLISEILELLINNNVPIPEIDNILVGAIKLPDLRKMKTVLKSKSNNCMVCTKTDVDLQMHHVATIENNPELKYDLNNVVLLCPQCHKASHGTSIEQPKGLIQRIIQKERRLAKFKAKELGFTGACSK